jgi:hypothetical protein
MCFQAAPSSVPKVLKLLDCADEEATLFFMWRPGVA